MSTSDDLNEVRPLLNNNSINNSTDAEEDSYQNNKFSKMTDSEAVRGIFSLNHSESSHQDNNDNHWTKENQDTLTNWINSLSQASFIYQYAKEKEKKKLTNFSLVSFLLTGTGALLAGISSIALSSDEEPYKTIALAFSITVFCLNSGSTVINGIINKIYKLDNTVESYTKYIERIDILYAKLSEQNNISPSLRKDGNAFILKQSEKYTELIQKCPDVEPKLYEEAYKNYQEFLHNVV